MIRQPAQLTLDGLYAIPRPPDPQPGSLDIDARLRHALSKAIKECPHSRYEIAARISELVGSEVSKHMLDAYSAESRETHKFPVQYLPALIAATGATWLLDVIAERCGCVVLEGADAVHAKRGRVRAQIEQLRRLDRELSKISPACVNTGNG
ncbi:MAG: hypothetical protein O3A21_08055 [Proteobacteria bacterium]|nr:hypothetical protein [Pseudomonadota bacterium]